MSAHPHDKLQRYRACLREIADTLCIAEDAFFAPYGSLLLNVDADGTRCILMSDAQNIPFVRHVTSTAAGEKVTDEQVIAFLARNPDGRHQQVLAALINSLLAQHLAT